jgi:hypothetical protein
MRGQAAQSSRHSEASQQRRGASRGLGLARPALEVDPIHVHLVGDVLDRLIAEVVVGDRGLVAHLLVHGRRDADAPGLGQGLEAGGDVHAVAVEAIAIDGHVAHVRTDAKLHLALLGDVGVAGAQHALDLDRALDRADRGRELREEVVAREVGDAAPVLAHQRLDLLPVRRQRADRRLLIGCRRSGSRRACVPWRELPSDAHDLQAQQGTASNRAESRHSDARPRPQATDVLKEIGGEPAACESAIMTEDLHFIGMNSRVHPKYKTKYRVNNWLEYDRALVQRGEITLWISDDAIEDWKPAASGGRGGQRKFSDHAIETALMLRLVFKLPHRQAEGFLRSILSLMDILPLRVVTRKHRHLSAEPALLNARIREWTPRLVLQGAVPSRSLIRSSAGVRLTSWSFRGGFRTSRRPGAIRTTDTSWSGSRPSRG